MGKAVVRVGDICSSHPPYPPRKSIAGSNDVFVNGKAVVRVGDKWDKHTHPVTGETHDSISITGSTTVFVNGKAVVRVGDVIVDTSQRFTSKPVIGSNDVSVG